MDRPIEKSRVTTKRVAGVVSFVMLLAIGIAVFSTTSESSLTTSGERTRIAKVERGTFEEYIPITGSVRPITTVFLDLEEGGIVEEIIVDSGNRVEKGDLILTLSNASLQKQNIDSETRLLENLDRLRTSKRNLTEQRLLLDEELLDLNHEIQELEKKLARYESMMTSSTPPISEEEYETERDNLEYLYGKRKLLKQRIAEEAVLREEQMAQIDKSITLVNRSLGVLQEIEASLDVRAPISGFLSSMDAEVGQSFTAGARIGQIDKLDRFKVQADVDQFYISKVQTDQVGTFEFAGETHELEITKIYPEVTDEFFRIDLEFPKGAVAGIKRGQTLRIDLQLSDSSVTTIADKGGFYRETNGNWVYRVDKAGETAEKVRIVSGRQNPEHFEVLEGLEVGDWIITSSYTPFNGAEVIHFSEPLETCPSC